MAKAIQDNNERLRELGTAPIGKLLLKYSLPAVVGTVVSAVYNIIDSIVIGHAIDDPYVVAGMAVTFPVMNLVTALGMLVCHRLLFLPGSAVACLRSLFPVSPLCQGIPPVGSSRHGAHEPDILIQ